MSGKTYPSIFNDVIGPVMRGPSSSHCAASVRIGRIARDIMEGDIKDVMIKFDKSGSLATTHKTQGSDMGLFGGLLGWDATDSRMKDSEKYFKESGINIEFRIIDKKAEHPNTYEIGLKSSNETHTLTAISSGGGSIEIIKIDGYSCSLRGDIYTTLFFDIVETDEIIDFLKNNINVDEILIHQSGTSSLVEVRTVDRINTNVICDIHNKYDHVVIKQINPVFPVITKSGVIVPFVNCRQMLEYNRTEKLDMWELAVRYECARGDMTKEEVIDKMTEIISILDQSVKDGIRGTVYSDRILGYQSGKYKDLMDKSVLPGGDTINSIILYVTALMEVKSSMGLIVAAPTAGACGGLPGAVLAVADSMGPGIMEKTKAMLAAGMIGVFISAISTFAAETCGCQAECGSGSGMAAAALVCLAGGTTEQAVSAASIALQNTFGMICDPVANRVEVPCLGKNVMAATNAFSCANMALADFDEVIPLDEVIETMDKVGKSIPRELRCTGLGGLSITKTSKEIEKKLN